MKHVRWTVEIGGAGVDAVSIGDDGTVYVSTPHTLLATRDAEILWTVPATPLGGCIVLANGLLVVSEGSGLAVRRQADGGLESVIDAPGHSLPTVVAGRLVYVHTDSRRRHDVRAVDLAGNVFWSRRLDRGSHYPPLPVGPLVAVADGEALRVLDAEGGEAWEYRGRPGPGWTGPLIGLPDGRLLAQYEADDDTATLVVDPVGHTVGNLPIHLPLRRPMATNGVRLAVAGWAVEDADRQPQASLYIVSLPHGRLEDSLPLSTRVVSVAASPEGAMAYAASPPSDRWAAYRDFPGFEASTRCVVGLAQGGSISQWAAPAPITGPIAVGIDGDLIVPVADHLISLGA